MFGRLVCSKILTSEFLNFEVKSSGAKFSIAMQNAGNLVSKFKIGEGFKLLVCSNVFGIFVPKTELCKGKRRYTIKISTRIFFLPVLVFRKQEGLMMSKM